ncbi:hypothetical protein GOP47_0003739 [Adiantum capillus-veneris]|uniref:Exonuclease domain-containing protein n=1 Tax=Adiantum capillus-veneris TaxID=13818 RepID=A0A9D4V779_ADICA|nr:hypothetical protein GOP47_0003739 [Adiantum capillus-veneris]
MGGRKLDDFTEKDTEVLVRIVKSAQARSVKGSKGEWKDFLKSSKQLRVGPSDPAKRPWSTLVEFVHTFTDDADIQMVKQIRASEMRHKRLEALESGGLWRNSPEQELVRQTYQHRRYKEYYTFPSFDKGWVLTDSKKAEGQSVTEHMISLDCEMVDCDNKTKGLVRVCAIDAEYKLLVDMLVKPERPVIDYLTPITGISEADLTDVTCSFYEAQTAVLKLLNSDTILVGHSLHNDLKALKIDHPRLIDTSFLFQFRNKPDCYNAGLNSLCKAILGYEFREDGKPHDCVIDATIPMRIVHHVLKHGIEGSIDIPAKMLDEGQLCKLYFHGIPPPVSVHDLQKLIPHDCPCDLDDISWSNVKYGTTYAVFRNIDDANKTFERLKGPVGEDSFGRPQKTVMVTVQSKKKKAQRILVRIMVLYLQRGGKYLRMLSLLIRKPHVLVATMLKRSQF